MGPQLYRPYETGTNIQWNLSYTDPMGLALVYNIYTVGPQLYRPYGTGTGLYNIYTVGPQLYRPYGTGTSLYIICSYTEPMGLVLVCIYTGTSVI